MSKKRIDKKKTSTSVSKPEKPSFKLPLTPILIGILVVVWLVLFSNFLFSGKMLMGTDMLQNGYYDRLYLQKHLKEGFFPQWDQHLHGGMPFIDAMHGVIFYPTVLFNLIMPVHYAVGFSMVLHILLAGLFMFLFLRKMKLTRWISFLGGLAYMLAPFFVSYIYGGHDAKMFVMTLFPLAMFMLTRAMIKRRLFDYLLFGLIYTLMVVSPHMQLAYFASWGLGAWFVFWQIRDFVRKEKPLKKVIIQTCLFLVAVAITVGIAMPQIYPPTKYLGEYSSRIQNEERDAWAWSTSWSLGWEEVVGMFNHEFAGISVGKSTYWGRNPFKLNSDYAGLIPLILGILGLIISRRSEKWFFFGVAMFAAIFALGGSTPFFRIFFHLIPQVNKFRAPAMIIFLFGFSFVMLAAFALETIADEERRLMLNAKKFNIALLSIGGALLLGTIIISMGQFGILKMFNGNMTQKQVQLATAALPYITKTAWINTFIALIVLGLTWLWYHRKLKGAITIAIIAALVLFDQWRVDKTFVQVIDPEMYYSKRPVVDFLHQKQAEEGPFRVFIMPNTFGQLADTYLGNYDIDEVTFSALHGNQLLWYDEFVGRLSQPPNLVNPSFWNVLNVRYVVGPGRLPADFEKNLKLVGQVGNTIVYENPNALRRAILLPSYKVVDDPKEIIEGLKANSLDYYHYAYLEEDPGIPQGPSPDSIPMMRLGKITNHDKVNSYNVEIDAPQGGILFISECWFPSWKCYEDGKEIPILRADYAFRGVPLEPGKHNLEFKYESKTLKTSIKLMFLFMSLTVILGGVSLFLSKKK